MVAQLSRGNVTISSSSMNDPPVMNSNFLSHSADKELAVAAFKRRRDVWNLLAFLNVTIGPELAPGPSAKADAEILEFIVSSMIQLFHPTSTCKTGGQNDTLAVVDTVGRVLAYNPLGS